MKPQVDLFNVLAYHDTIYRNGAYEHFYRCVANGDKVGDTANQARAHVKARLERGHFNMELRMVYDKLRSFVAGYKEAYPEYDYFTCNFLEYTMPFQKCITPLTIRLWRELLTTYVVEYCNYSNGKYSCTPFRSIAWSIVHNTQDYESSATFITEHVAPYEAVLREGFIEFVEDWLENQNDY